MPTDAHVRGRALALNLLTRGEQSPSECRDCPFGTPHTGGDSWGARGLFDCSLLAAPPAPGETGEGTFRVVSSFAPECTHEDWRELAREELARLRAEVVEIEHYRKVFADWLDVDAEERLRLVYQAGKRDARRDAK